MKRKTRVVHVEHRNLAYFPVVAKDGWRMGIAEEGKPGYFKVKDESDLGGTYPSREEAQATADAMNERLGLSKKAAAKIVASSLAKARS